MRIVCQKCAAAYAIEDRVITPKGVRAQCPRCRHMQLVKREGEASAPPPTGAPPSAPAAPGIAAVPMPAPAVPMPAPPLSVPEDPLFDFLGPPPSAPAASPAPSFDFDPSPAFDFESPPASTAAPVPSLDFDFSEPPELAPVVAPAPVPAAAPARPRSTPSCKSCGKPLLDPFDQALGVCDACRQGSEEAAPAPKSTETFDLPPMSAPSLGNDAPSTSAAPRADTRPVQAAAPALSTEPRSARGAATLPAEPRSGVRSAAAPRSAVGSAKGVVAFTAAPSRGKGVLIAAGVGVLLLLGGGAAFFLKQQGSSTASSGATSTVTASSLSEPLQSVLARWRLMFVDIEGDGAQLLAEGKARLAQEQRDSYASAEESFQQVLVLDPSSDDAIAGYVQALALGRGRELDDATYQQARRLIEFAEARSERKPDVLVAHANLLMTRASNAVDVEQARALAEEVLTRGEPPSKAEAYLVLGRIVLSSSRELAAGHFKSAQELAPKLSRVHYYLGLTYEAAGEFAPAVGELKKRLELDPGDWDSVEMLARIYLQVDERGGARSLYEDQLKRSPGNTRAQLALAVMLYQVDRNYPAAITTLRGLLRDSGRYEDVTTAEIWLHLAAVERLAGHLDEAAKAARQALQLAGDFPEAHLQLFLVALARKDSAVAAGHLASLRGRLGDAVLEKLLEGKLRMVEQKAMDALERFTEASKLDARRMDVQLLAGVAAAQAGRTDEAIRILNQVQKLDPTRLAPHGVPTRFYMRPTEVLVGTEGLLLAKGKGNENVSLLFDEALLRFHLEDYAEADRLLKSVLGEDRNNAPSLAYRALIALKRKDKNASKDALKLAKKAVAVNKHIYITRLALGMVLMEQGQAALAKKEFYEVLVLEPGIHAAEVKLAELEMDSSPRSARERLRKVLRIDPDNRQARRVLFQLDTRG